MVSVSQRDIIVAGCNLSQLSHYAAYYISSSAEISQFNFEPTPSGGRAKRTQTRARRRMAAAAVTAVIVAGQVSSSRRRVSLCISALMAHIGCAQEKCYGRRGIIAPDITLAFAPAADTCPSVSGERRGRLIGRQWRADYHHHSGAVEHNRPAPDRSLGDGRKRPAARAIPSTMAAAARRRAHQS